MIDPEIVGYYKGNCKFFCNTKTEMRVWTSVLSAATNMNAKKMRKGLLMRRKRLKATTNMDVKTNSE